MSIRRINLADHAGSDPRPAVGPDHDVGESDEQVRINLGKHAEPNRLDLGPIRADAERRAQQAAEVNRPGATADREAA